MSELIIEILIGIVILCLLGLVIIPLYHEVQITINSIVYGSTSNKIENSLFRLEDGLDYMGGEVIAQINYFKDFNDRIITVVNGSQSISYIDSTYLEEEFLINLYEEYSFTKNSTSEYVEYIYIKKS